jgi:hypothetical protein
MKRIFKIINVAVLILMIPLATILGQDKKSEQKIKIIVNDGSDTKVIVDTVLTGNNGPDSLILKDGSVLRLKQNHKYRVISRSKGDKVWVGEDGPEKEGDDTFTIYDSDNESDQNVDKTRFVIAKDGMVVTIEGTDEEKTKDLAKEIEKRLGVENR